MQATAIRLAALLAVSVAAALPSRPPTKRHCETSAAHWHAYGDWLAAPGNNLAPPPAIGKRQAAVLSANDTRCPAETTQNGDSAASLCPYYYEFEHDAKRIPRWVSQARCKCERAVTGHHLFVCEPVMLETRVLRLDDDCEATRATESVAVACVSVVQPTYVLDPAEFRGVENTVIVHPPSANEY